MKKFVTLILFVTLFQFSFINAEEQKEIVFSTIIEDLTGDQIEDIAILKLNKKGDVELKIYISVKEDILMKVIDRSDLVWGDNFGGREPSLSVNSRGSLLIKSQNFGVGRSRWEETLTVAFRNFQFYVVGFTYSYFDTFDKNYNGNCDINLFTGKAFIDGKHVQTNFRTELLSLWTNTEKLMNTCITKDLNF